MMDDRMTSDEILKLLNLLIGNTEPSETYWLEREQNLKKLIDVVNWSLDGVLFCRDACKCNGGEHAHEMKMRAEQAMDEWRVWLTENLGILATQ